MTPDPVIRILVVDDHTLFRRALTALLSGEPGLEVVGDAADAGEAQRQAERLQPDVILLDNHLPGVTGVQAVPALLAACPRCKVLILTVSDGGRCLDPGDRPQRARRRGGLSRDDHQAGGRTAPGVACA